MEGKLRVLVLIFIFVSHLSGWGAYKLLGAEENGEGWVTVDSELFTISYPKEVDMKRINRRIDTRFIDVDLPATLPAERNPEKLLAYKFEQIFRKVEKILDMYPRGIHINVKIYRNAEELPMVGQGISGGINKASSFYIHKQRTIYTTVKDISEAVVSHEIAHSIIDHYFVVLPPRKVQELLANYVETHLED
jgi:hypothetical protein